MTFTLTTMFLSAEASGKGVATLELEDVLTGLLTSGREAWPRIPLPPNAFMRHLAQRVPHSTPLSLVASALRHVCAADLYLACGCTLGIPEAITAFDIAYLQALPAQLPRLRLSPEESAELKQQLREHLLTGDQPRIGKYMGTGLLRSFVLVIAARQRQSRRRSMDVHVEEYGLRELSEALRATGNLEIDHLSRQFQVDLDDAVRNVWGTLTDEQCYYLELHYVRQLTERDLARLHALSQPTIHRRLSAAKRALSEGVRRLLAERLRLTETGLDSLVELIRSQLYLSLSQLLATRQRTRPRDDAG